MTDRYRAAIAAAIVWILCAVYAGQFMHRGWIPHDEGTIGQSAERVLAGDVPHRDFDEVYTGGLTYLHAAGMKMLGVNLRTPRQIVFVFFLAFLAAVYAIGRRVSSPGGALVAMSMAAVWSLPNYFVSLPSWYNLFFATFGVLAFLRYLDSSHRRWLVIAGVCGGLSVLAKISGVFYLAGGLVFLAYLEQSRPTDRTTGATRFTFWPVVAAPVAVFLFLLFRMLLTRDVTGGAVSLFLPATAICLFVVWREARAQPGALRDRARRLFALVWPFAAGATVPILAYVLYFWSQDAVAELIRGVFILPQRRLVEASAKPLSLGSLGMGVPYVLLLLAGWRRAIPREALLAAILAGLLGTLLALGNYPPVYRITWAAAMAMPMAVVGVCIFTHVDRAYAIASSAHARVFLTVAMAATVALVQFPYATPIYFCYSATMTILAVTAFVSARPNAPRKLHLAVAAFFFLFAIVFVNRTYGWNLGVRFLAYEARSELVVSRGGLRVPDEDSRTYEEVVRVLQKHAAGGTIYAAPDCPEVYFLSGFPNPTRVLFDFLTPDPIDERAMASLVSGGSIRAVVINTVPLFSPPLEPGVIRLLEKHFPSSQEIGQFVVRFR